MRLHLLLSKNELGFLSLMAAAFLQLVTGPLAIMRYFLFVVIFIFSFRSFLAVASSSPAIGITYRPQVPKIPSSEQVVSALIAAGIRHVVVRNPSPTILQSFSYSDISLTVSIPNTLVPSLSSNLSAAATWLSDHVLPFHPRVRFSSIAVGHDEVDPDVIVAISNLISSCSALGLPKFPISTVHSFSILYPSFPPSSARFQESLMDNYTKPLLELLEMTKSPFMIDLFPFHLYRTNPNITLGFTMFEEEEFSYRDDPGTKLSYRNLFDEMVDATLTALAAAGHSKMQLLVTGTGWPTSGGESASEEIAGRYNRGLVKHLMHGLGTPLRSDFGVREVYVYELFDDWSRKTDGTNEWEKHFGIWYRDLKAKYDLHFSSGTSYRFVIQCWILLVLVMVTSLITV